MSELKTLETTAEIVEALGGIAKVAELTGRSYNAAANWVTAPTFPADTFVLLKAELRKLGFIAPPSLWRMIPERAA